MSDRAEIAVAEALLDIGAVHFTPRAPVVFRSGIRAPVYVDNRRLIFHPHQWRVVIDALRARIANSPLTCEVIAGIAEGGIPHSAALAYALGRASVFLRKSAKTHGRRDRIVGGDVRGQRVLLVEDMVTTGGSLLAGVTALREAGALVSDCLAITSYELPETRRALAEASLRLRPLAGFGQILDIAAVRGLIDAEGCDEIRAWQRAPHDWRAPQPS